MEEREQIDAAITTATVRPVILAGGSGTRLWPYSRVQRPKQFLNLVEDQSLFQATMSRLSALPGVSTPIIVCAQQHQFMVTEQLREAQITDYQIVLEPARRDTAPAITLAALVAATKNENSILFVLASDHDIRCDVALSDSVRQAVLEAQTGKLVTFGVRPASAHTGYGYIQVPSSELASDSQNITQSFSVQRFVEKPNKELAETYFADGAYFWNSGMFVFAANMLMDQLAVHAPDVLDGCKKTLLESTWRDAHVLDVDISTFSQCPSISIDYALMEKSEHIAMVPLETEWSDVGDWSALWQIAEKNGQGNVEIGDVLTRSTRNCYVRAGNKLVATVGVDDLVIVESDDALLVANKACSQEIKEVVKDLELQARSEVEHHRQVYRPWGHYSSVADGNRFQVKRLVVKPGQKLSTQKHFHRAEHWVVVQGTAKVMRNNKELLLCENESVYIPIGTVYSLENPGRIDLEIIEIQSGSYLGDDDLVRDDDCSENAKNNPQKNHKPPQRQSDIAASSSVLPGGKVVDTSEMNDLAQPPARVAEH